MTLARSIGLLSVLALFSCKKGDKVPAYLQLGTVTVATDPDTEGTSSHKITELWVFAENEALGVWESGSRLPVLRTGNTGIQLIAGIRRNGDVNDRVQYPFYDTWTTTADMALNETTVVDPVFTYFPNLQYWIEGFEDNGYRFERVAGDTTMNVITDPALVFEGSACGEMYVDTGRAFMRMVTSESIPISGNDPVYLELNYRSDHRILVGAVYTLAGTVMVEPYLFVAPTLRADGGMPWNKIYVDLSQFLNRPGATEKKFYFEMSLLSGSTAGRAYLDNIKLVHR